MPCTLLRNGLLALGLLISSAAQSQWTSFGLQGKTVADIAANQNDGSVLAVAGDKLYHTNNNGLDWNLLERGIEGLSVLSVALDLDETIYIGTSSGVFSASNPDDEFESLNTTLPNDFGLYPSVGSICILNDELFIGTSAGVYKASKSSFEWQLFNKNLPFLDVNAMLVFFNDNIFLGMSSGLYRSSTREANWEKVYPQIVNDIVVVGNDLYAAAYVENGCYPLIKSSDFGNTWTPIGQGWGPCVGESLLISGNSIWIGTSGSPGIFSTDAGETWANLQMNSVGSVLVFERRGTSLLAGSNWFPNNAIAGGIFVRSNILENINETLYYPEFVTAPGEYSEIINVEIESREPSARIYYTTDGSAPDAQSNQYTTPIRVKESMVINAIAIDNKGGQSKVNTGYFRLNVPLAIESIGEELSHAYPNPFTDELWVSVPGPPADIKMIDVMGRIVHEQSVEDTKLTIRTEALAPGLYHILVTSGGKPVCKTVVKN